MQKTINKKQKTVNINREILNNKHGIETIIMEKIKTEEVKMKPKWLFIVGSVLAIAGLIGLTIGATFLTNLTIFLLRKRGPGYGKLELMLEGFPLWVPILAVFAVILGIWLLKKYEFSYKKNFLLIIFIFIFSIIIAGFLIDKTGLNTVWSHKGAMGRFYQQLEDGDDNLREVQRKTKNYRFNGNYN